MPHQLTPNPNSCGQALVEYALILGFVALVSFAVLGLIGTDVAAILAKVEAGF
jgi:Flp pilus assembly pilin Flp